MIRRRRASSPLPAPAPVPPLEDNDLLEEILLRLPPQPSSLPRASSVCTRWRRLLSDPRFLRRLRPPVLGLFSGGGSRSTVFIPLDAPDRIPAPFAVPRPTCSYDQWDLVGCRDGLAVILARWRAEVILWHPLTGHQRRVPFPPWFKEDRSSRLHHASVLCAAAEDGHVPGECHLHPFKLVFVSCAVLDSTEICASLYVSETGFWGNKISTATTDTIYNGRPAVLVGNNALCWLLRGGDILEFDFERESLGVTEKPGDAHVDGGASTYLSWQVIRTEEGGLGLAVLSNSEVIIKLWHRECNSDGVVGWELQKIIPLLNDLFPLPVLTDVGQRFPGMQLAQTTEVMMVGYDEQANMIVLSTCIGDFMLRLETVEFKRFSNRYGRVIRAFYPYSSFYVTAGRGTDGGAEV